MISYKEMKGELNKEAETPTSARQTNYRASSGFNNYGMSDQEPSLATKIMKDLDLYQLTNPNDLQDKPEIYDDPNSQSDRLMSDLKAAVGLVANGQTLREASGEVKRSPNWLAKCKNNNDPNLKIALDEFRHNNEITDQEEKRLLNLQKIKNKLPGKDKPPNQALTTNQKNTSNRKKELGLTQKPRQTFNDRTAIREFKKAIKLIADGNNLKQASAAVGKNHNWLSTHKCRNNQRLEIALEEFLKENDLSDQAREALTKKLRTRRSKLKQNQIQTKLKEVIGLVADGLNFKQASLEAGMSSYWLSIYKGNNIETVLDVLDDLAQERNLSERKKEELAIRLKGKKIETARKRLKAKLKEAIELVAEGQTMEQASEMANRSSNWLSYYQGSRNEIFQKALNEYSQEQNLSDQAKSALLDKLTSKQEYLKGDQLAEKLKQAFGFIATGDDLKRASEKVGKNPSWVSTHKKANSRRFLAILNEFIQEGDLSRRTEARLLAKLKINKSS